MSPAAKRWWMRGLIVAAALLAMWPVLGNRFINWDDRDQITQNPDFNPVRFERMITYWRGPYVGSLYPVSYDLFGVLSTLGRTAPDATGETISPLPFHATSIILHAAAGLLVFAILRLFVASDMAACGGALLFAVHPVQVESVAWVSGMNTLLFALLSLWAIWQYLLAIRTESAQRRTVLLASATIGFILALWSKPTAVVVPVIAGLLDWLLTRRHLRESAKVLIVWILLSIPIVYITRQLQTNELVTPTAIWSRPLVAGDALAFYVYKLVFPLRLLVDYGRTPLWVQTHPISWAGALVPIALALVCWKYRRKFPWLATSLAIFVVALLPVLGLTPFNVQMISTVTDRYLYLAMLAPALVLAFVTARAGSRGAYVVIAIALALLAVRSSVRAGEWFDEFTLFQPELQLNPRSLAAHQVLGVTYSRMNKPEEAAQHLAAALDVKPDDPRSLYNLANLLLRHSAQPADSIPYYRAAIARMPSEPRFHSNLAVALEVSGDPGGAQAEFTRALELRPGMLEATRGLERLRAKRATTNP